MLKVKFVNNYKYKGNWNNLFHFKYVEDSLRIKNLLIGIFGFFIFIAYRRKPWEDN